MLHLKRYLTTDFKDSDEKNIKLLAVLTRRGGKGI